jgi:hypothetical protein
VSPIVACTCMGGSHRARFKSSLLPRPVHTAVRSISSHCTTMAGKHTIILVQYTNAYQVANNVLSAADSTLILNLCYLQTRSYMDFPGVNAAMDALVKMYEHKLKELNPTVQHITYDISDLYNYLDSLHDVCGLV